MSKDLSYLKAFVDSGLSYTDIAHELGCCEQTARNKISGKTRITKVEKTVLDNLFKGENSCTTLRHKR